MLLTCNMLRRHEALTIGRVYAKYCAEDITVPMLKDALSKGDYSLLNKLYHFGAPIIVRLKSK